MTITTLLIKDKKESLEEGPLRHEVYNEDSDKCRKGRNGNNNCLIVSMKVTLLALVVSLVFFIGALVYMKINNEAVPDFFIHATYKSWASPERIDYNVLRTTPIEEISSPLMPDDAMIDTKKREHLTESKKHDKENVMEAFGWNAGEYEYEYYDDNELWDFLFKTLPREFREEDWKALIDQATEITVKSKRSVVEVDELKDNKICAEKLNFPDEKLDALVDDFILSETYSRPPDETRWTVKIMIMHIFTYSPLKIASDVAHVFGNKLMFQFAYWFARVVAEGVPFPTQFQLPGDRSRMLRITREFREIYLSLSPSFQSCMKELEEDPEQLQNSNPPEVLNEINNLTEMKS